MFAPTFCIEISLFIEAAELSLPNGIIWKFTQFYWKNMAKNMKFVNATDIVVGQVNETIKFKLFFRSLQISLIQQIELSSIRINRFIIFFNFQETVIDKRWKILLDIMVAICLKLY